MIHFHPISEPISPTRSITSDDGGFLSPHRHVKSIGTNNLSVIYCEGSAEIIFFFFFRPSSVWVFFKAGTAAMCLSPLLDLFLVCSSDVLTATSLRSPTLAIFCLCRLHPRYLFPGSPCPENLNCKCNTSNDMEI